MHFGVDPTEKTFNSTLCIMYILKIVSVVNYWLLINCVEENGSVVR